MPNPAPGVMCPQCGAPMILRNSYRGAFFGCSAFPTCRGTRAFSDYKPEEKKPAPALKPMGAKRGWAAVAEALANEPEPAESVKPVKVKGSPQQDSIWKEITKGKTHLVINALAGTGKSFTLVHGVLRLRQTKGLEKARIGIFAFNVHIAREVGAKLNELGITDVFSATWNSFAWRQLRKALTTVEMMEDKLESILEEIIPEAEIRPLGGAVGKMVRLLKCHMYEPTTENMEELMERFDIDCSQEQIPDVFGYATRAMQECWKRDGVADFDDQIWMVVKGQLPVDQFDIVMVDESQDLSTNQQMLAMMACKNGRMVVVGDAHQAIYGFKGADVTSMPRMKEMLEATKIGVKELPLTVSRRCAKLHIKLAQMIVPEIGALPEAPDGLIEITDTPEKALELMRPGDLVLCRVNAPLISKCYSLIRRGVKAVVRGRDIGKGMISLIKRLRPQDIHDLMDKVREFEAKEMQKLTKLGRKGSGRIMILQDRVECMLTLCEGTNNLSELQNKIEMIFSDFDESGRPKNAVVFSTVHRGKGLEASNIFILSPELMPHPMARQEWEKVQELNLAYVAVTRAKWTPDYPGRLVFAGQIPPAFGGPPLPSKPVRSSLAEVEHDDLIAQLPLPKPGEFQLPGEEE